MRQTFTTVINKEYPENDESIVANLILVKGEEGINIRITKETGKIQSGGEIQVASKEVLELNSVGVDVLNIIRKRTNIWVLSESKAAIFEEFEDVEGKYEKTKYQSITLTAA